MGTFLNLLKFRFWKHFSSQTFWILGSQRDNLLTCLADLFHNIATQKKRVGTIAPKRFITKLKKENGKHWGYLLLEMLVIFDFWCTIFKYLNFCIVYGGWNERCDGTAAVSPSLLVLVSEPVFLCVTFLLKRNSRKRRICSSVDFQLKNPFLQIFFSSQVLNPSTS